MTLKDYNTVQQLVELAKTIDNTAVRGSLLKTLEIASVEYFIQHRDRCVEVNIEPFEGLSIGQLEDLVQL